jgi:hypothetical protein
MIGWTFLLEKFHFLLLDQVEHMHEHIRFVFKVLIEASFGNTAVFDNPVRGRVFQAVIGKFLDSSVHDRFPFFGGEVEESLFRHKNVTCGSYDLQVTL